MTGDRPTGADLVDELRAAASAAGVSMAQFVIPLASGRGSPFLTQLAMAKLPTPLTIARVRALIEGRPIPSHRGGTNPDGRRCSKSGGRPPEIRMPGDEIEQRRRLTDMAHEQRLPGETIAAAVKRLGRQRSIISEMGDAR